MPDIYQLPHVVITGDPSSGFELYGPFPDHQAAVAYASTQAADIARCII